VKYYQLDAFYLGGSLHKAVQYGLFLFQNVLNIFGLLVIVPAIKLESLEFVDLEKFDFYESVYDSESAGYWYSSGLGNLSEIKVLVGVFDKIPDDY